MRRFHLSIAVSDVAASVQDYSARLQCAPQVVIDNEYALWRTDSLNFSVRRASEAAGSLRHLGWEDDSATRFEGETDVNGLVWERFAQEQQVAEIRAAWPNGI